MYCIFWTVHTHHGSDLYCTVYRTNRDGIIFLNLLYLVTCMSSGAKGVSCYDRVHLPLLGRLIPHTCSTYTCRLLAKNDELYLQLLKSFRLPSYPMGKKSKRSFRIKGLGLGLMENDFNKKLQDLNTGLSRYKDCSPSTSLAKHVHTHDEFQCGTVSTGSKRQKSKLLQTTKSVNWECTHRLDWNDVFDGITVLHSPENAEIE